MEIFKGLWSAMQAKGFAVDPSQVNFHGDYTRFPRDSSGLNGWLRVDYSPELNYAQASYGDWKSGEKYSWESGDGKSNPERDEEILGFLAERKAANEKKKLAGYAEAAARADKIRTTLDYGHPAPYLERKGLPGLKTFGMGVSGTDLYVPAWGAGGHLAGYQKIQADGGKYFQPEMRIKGSFCPLYPAEGRRPWKRIFFAEGIATAGSIFEAFNREEPVIACFNAGNLASVVSQFRKEHPSAELVVCGDEDILTKVRGQWKNPGREAALGAGADKVVFPGIYLLSKEGEPLKYSTDFNDTHQMVNLEMVRSEIEAQLRVGTSPEPTQLRPPAHDTGESGAGDLGSEGSEGGTGQGPRPEAELGAEEGDPRRPGEKRSDQGSRELDEAMPGALPRKQNGEGKPPSKPGQQRVARALQDHYGRNLVKSGEDVFKWEGTHWRLCESADHDLFFRQAAAIAGFDFKAGEINAVLEIFLKNIPHVPSPVNLFEARSDRSNFLNGTLHLAYRAKSAEEMAENPSGGTHWLSTEFREHRREDWCNSVIPLEYKPHAELPANEDFDKMLANLWPGAEGPAKIRLYKQVLGSSLLPMFPKIFFFVGPPGTGKSTALMLIRKLLSEQNISSVDPTKWGKEFYLEPMAGKLANIHLDIDTKRRLDDSVLKNVIDRAVFQINRKGKTIVKAMLPAFHAFGANEMPPSLDANSGAFNRRMVIVKTEAKQPGEGGGGEYSDWVWQRGSAGVLKAALEGLEDLLNSGGRFAEPESSKEEKRAWGNESDYLGQFLHACATGDFRGAGHIKIILDKDAKIMSADLHALFLEWAKKEDIHHRVNGAALFGRMLSKRGGFERHLTNRGTEWIGIGLDAGGSGSAGPGAGELPPEVPPTEGPGIVSQF